MNTLITELIQSINKLSDIINYQTPEIQYLKEDNRALKKEISKINTNIDNNTIVQISKIDSLSVKQKTDNNTILTINNDNNYTNIDYTNNDNCIELFNNKLELSIDNTNTLELIILDLLIIDNLDNNSDKSNNKTQLNKNNKNYIIKLDNIDTNLEYYLGKRN